MLDALVLDCNSLGAGSSVTKTGTLKAKGDFFHITGLGAEVRVILKFTVGGEDMCAQGGGIVIDPANGVMQLPAEFVVEGSAEYSAVVTGLKTAGDANDGRVTLYGYWT